MAMNLSKRALAAGLAVALAASGVIPSSSLVLAAEEAATTGAIRGTLVDANGQPMAGFKLRVLGADGGVHESEPTGPDGKFEIGDLPPGTYTYEIVDPEGRIVTVKIPPVTVQAGTAVTQPIAIVPKKGKKGPLVAWLLGGGGALAAIVIINNNKDDSGDSGKKMTPSGN